MNEDVVTTGSSGKAAILIVNGGATAEANRWIRLCLERITAYTDYPNYCIYLWNNRSADRELEDWFLSQPGLTLLSAAGYEALHHPHRTPLQRLYHLARQEGAHYIVTMDSDAHPLRAGWLTHLLTALDDGAALAGVWRDEMSATTRPYVHPSCLCTTVAFVERHHLRFDFDHTHSLEKNDTLSHFTWVAEAEGAPIYRLQRSNRRSFHYLMGGIYGDLIYHHGAASRASTVFRDDAGDPDRAGRTVTNEQLRDLSAAWLFNDRESYLGWVRGDEVPSAAAQQMARLLRDVGQGAGQRRQGFEALNWKRLLRKRTKQIPVLGHLVARLRQMRLKPTGAQRDARQVDDSPMVSPFTEDNLAALPRGWAAKPPDFVGIGAPKSGTTWWYALLLDHPQVVPNRVERSGSAQRKELRFFVHFQHHDLAPEQVALYRQAFAAPPGAVCGEFSTPYLAYPLCIEHLAVAAPATRIIVVLRNPIDRFISHLNHLTVNRRDHVFRNLDQKQRQIYDKFSLYIEAIFNSLYSIGLERLFHCFEQERVLILQYERVVRFPEEELARAYRFLGVDDRYCPKDVAERVNVHPYVVPKPSSSERARLATYFSEDVRRVLKLCPELDAGLWPDFAPYLAGKSPSATEDHA